MEFLQTGPEPENPNIEPEQATEQLPFSRRETARTMIGVLLIMFLVMLDQTIVGTAIPRIVADLQGFYHIIWVTTAYLLTSTVPIPIYGKLSDLYGRKPLFLIGIVVFLAVSALSGAAQSQNAMPQKLGQASSTLVFFRQLGGTIGLAAMGSVLSSSYIPAFHAALPSALLQALPSRF